MDLGCVPENLRPEYQAKLSLMHERSIHTEIATIDTLHIIDVLSQLQLELRINDALDNRSCSSLTQTRMVYDNRQVHAIQNSMLHAATPRNVSNFSNDDQLTTNFPLHRSFQRLTHSIIGRHFLANPRSTVVFAITHPLLPFSFSNDAIPASALWTQHFSHNTDAETYIPLYCSSIAGADSITRLLLLPLARIETHDAARARGCWRSSHDGQLTVLYCVPTNPGPRSFHAWAIRRCHWPVPQPMLDCSNLAP